MPKNFSFIISRHFRLLFYCLGSCEDFSSRLLVTREIKNKAFDNLISDFVAPFFGFRAGCFHGEFGVAEEKKVLFRAAD